MGTEVGGPCKEVVQNDFAGSVEVYHKETRRKKKALSFTYCCLEELI